MQLVRPERRLKVTDWDERYRRGKHATSEPSKLLLRAVKDVSPGRALDVACGTGRHAIFLASLGWDVTAIDSSCVGIGLLNERARARGVSVNARVGDLESTGFQIEHAAFDLICVFYYLQRDLFTKLYDGLRSGGTFVAAIHMVDDTPGVKPMNPHFLLEPNELRDFFRGWTIDYYHETDNCYTDAGDHTRRSAKIIAHKLS